MVQWLTHTALSILQENEKAVKASDMYGGTIMDIEHLTYLLEMDRCRSLTHASECLYLSVQQLSRILRAIEEEYQIKIFERTNLGLNGVRQ